MTARTAYTTKAEVQLCRIDALTPQEKMAAVEEIAARLSVQ
jgi:hypothetical protein